MPQITPQNTTIVISHGAWHAPWHYAPLTSSLEAVGNTVLCPQLPSVGTRDPNFDADVACIRAAIISAVSSGRDVALLCHSYGGICGGEAAKGLVKPGGGNGNGVVKIVYLCAFAIPKGLCLMDVMPNGQPPDWFRLTGDGLQFEATRSEEIFYNDIEDEEQVRMFINGLENQPVGTKKSRTTWEPYREVSSAFIVCERDNAIPVAAQEGMVEGVGIKEVCKLDASHTPWVSRTEETTRAVLDALEGKLA